MPGHWEERGSEPIVLLVVVVNDADSETVRRQIGNIFPSQTSIIFWSISYQQLACKQHYDQIRSQVINRIVSVFQPSANISALVMVK